MLDRQKYAPFSLETAFVHGYSGSDPQTGAVSFPIYQTTTYRNPSLSSDIRYSYTRCGNPTREELENTVALMEGGCAGFAFSTGLAAVLAVFSLVKGGEHVLVSEDIYGGTYRLIEEILRPHGILFEYADFTDPDALASRIRPNTRMLYAETPTNPMMRVVDIARVASLAHAAGATLVIDNTFLTPFFQRPLSLGADIVLHSATKFLSGHHDTMAGVVVTADQATAVRLSLIQRTEGTGLAPFDCFMVLRGIKTLALRMKRHEENAVKLAAYLSENKHVETVHFIGLPDHPSYEVSVRQSDGFGGMLSFTLKDTSLVERVLCGGRLIAFAESLGGVSTLITYPMTQTHASVPKDLREKLGITDRLIRVSVGIEPFEDIVRDFESTLGGTV